MAIHKLDTKLFFGQKAFIDKGGKVLVLRDPLRIVKGQTGLDFPGGKFRWGNSLSADLKREVKEETNLEIEIGKPFAVWTNKGIKKRKGSSAHVVLVGFLCRSKSGQVKLSNEHDKYEWVDKVTYKKWEENTDYFIALEKYFRVKGT